MDYDKYEAAYAAAAGGPDTREPINLSQLYSNDNAIHIRDCTLPFQNSKLSKRSLWLVFSVKSFGSGKRAF